MRSVEADSKWAREMMDYLGEGKNTDTEGWHSMADDFLCKCIGKLIDDEMADEIRAWFDRGDKWYA
jgi:hypothetical protein